MDSILTSTKKALGINADDDSFDETIIMHINTILSTLTQLGVGPKEGFVIEDDTALWSDFISDKLKLRAVRSYLHIKVRLLFDLPQSSAHIEALKQQAAELEWRILVDTDTNSEEEIQNG